MHLKHLLFRALPLERIGPVLRARARRAALEGHPDRMRKVAQQVVNDLFRRGELVPMSAGQLGQSPRPLYRVAGTSRLVDLGSLAPEVRPALATVMPFAVLTKESGDRAAPRAEPAETPALPVAAAATAMELDLSSVAVLLEAMEEAQNLELGDPLSEVPQVVLGGILALLERHLPAVRLVLQLDNIDPSRPHDRRVVSREEGASVPFWLQYRRPGSLAVLSDPAELPAVVRQALGAYATDVTTVAVPVAEPAELGPDDCAEPRERGILFTATRRRDLAPHLLPLAWQLAGFVTRRWRQQWTVNRRIHTDSLTGVHNRAYFDTQFPIELERARRGGFPLALVLGDLDWFKRVNDTLWPSLRRSHAPGSGARPASGVAAHRPHLPDRRGRVRTRPSAHHGGGGFRGHGSSPGPAVQRGAARAARRRRTVGHDVVRSRHLSRGRR